MVINWGKEIVNLRNNIVIHYSYFGILWIFCLAHSVQFYEVTGPDNIIVRELTSTEVTEETGIERPLSQIPFMRRFGLLFFIALCVIFNLCST